MLLSLYRVLNMLCRAGVFLAFVTLMVAVLTQVLGRTIGSSPVWTEELTRFALVYLAALGAGLGLMTGDLVNVDILCDSLPGEWPRYLRIFASVATAGLALVLLPGAAKFVQIGALQSSPALGLQMTYVHLSVMFMILLLLLFAIIRALLDILRIDYLPSEPETN